MAQAARIILSEIDFAERENISPRTATRWRSTGEGPPFVRIGARRIGYRLEDVERWEASRTFTSRADEMAQAAGLCPAA